MRVFFCIHKISPVFFLYIQNQAGNFLYIQKNTGSDVNEARLECSPCDISNTERSTSLNSLKYCILFFTFHIAMVNHKYFVFIVGKCLSSQFGFFYQFFENLSYIPCLIYTKTCYCVILAFVFSK